MNADVLREFVRAVVDAQQLESVSFDRLAVIIMGDPAAVAGREDAENFYRQIGQHLENNGFVVQYDPGLAETQPIEADVWIAHSRGADRLKFAPSKTATVALSAPDVPGAIWHPRDEQRSWPRAPKVPSRYHFTLTPEMIEAIDAAISKV